MQSREEYKQEHGHYPDENANQIVNNPQWRAIGNGHYEWTGDTLDNSDIPVNLRGKIEFLSAPNAREVRLMPCGTFKRLEVPEAEKVCLDLCYGFESFEAPNAREVQMSRCGTLKSFKAPNAREVRMSRCDKLESFEVLEAKRVILSDCGIESFEAPEAMTVMLTARGKLKSFKAPKATYVHLDDCRKLERFEAPEATKIVLKNPNPNQHLRDIIIQQLKNPQKLQKFQMLGDDIAQDIKKADRELNVSEYVKQQKNEAQFNTFIGATQPGSQFTNMLLGTMDDRHPEKGAEILSKIMDYAGLKHKDLAVFNSEALLGYKENQGFADERIKDYKQQRIVQKTDEHTTARGAFR